MELNHDPQHNEQQAAVGERAGAEQAMPRRSEWVAGERGQREQPRGERAAARTGAVGYQVHVRSDPGRQEHLDAFQAKAQSCGNQHRNDKSSGGRQRRLQRYEQHRAKRDKLE